MKDHSKSVLFLAGDGVGPEIISVAKSLLDKLESKHSEIKLAKADALVGGSAIDSFNSPLPPSTLELALNADAILLGAVGGFKWDNLPAANKPEKGLLQLRQNLNLFSNFRPITLYPELENNSPLKREIISGVDLMIIRELTGDLYFGEPRSLSKVAGRRQAVNTMCYNEDEIRLIATSAFNLARLRKKKLCSVDKANVLENSILWREVVTELGADYPDVELSHMYVDNAAMQLVARPTQFDCILTSNLFGDILSDLAAMISGSIGILPSASIGKKSALFEPVHGSAPDIAGKNIANPIATIVSTGMLLEYLYPGSNYLLQINNAISKALKSGRTKDISSPGIATIGCEEMGNLIIKEL